MSGKIVLSIYIIVGICIWFLGVFYQLKTTPKETRGDAEGLDMLIISFFWPVLLPTFCLILTIKAAYDFMVRLVDGKEDKSKPESEVGNVDGL